MANEIRVSNQLYVLKTNLKHDSSESFSATLTGSKYDAAAVTVTTTAATIGISGVSSPGWSFFKNLDATNYLEIGVDDSGTFVPVWKLKAGESILVRLSTTALHAKANTASCVLEYKVFEE